MCGALRVVENERAANCLREHYFCQWLALSLACACTLSLWLSAPEWMPEEKDLHAILALFVSQLQQAGGTPQTRRLVQQACDLAQLKSLQIPHSILHALFAALSSIAT